MIDAHDFACSICGEINTKYARWFLVAENQWENKLKILEWNNQLAAQSGVHLLCSPSHVQELVVHWMATGSVHHPFARGPLGGADRFIQMPCISSVTVVDTGGARTIGELVVHRESVIRVLRENPESFQSMLEALSGALQQFAPSIHPPDGVSPARPAQ